MVETITPAVAPALAHIIERPRLIALLEEGGGSRVSVFAAPAGYGKTTLARQWSERQTGPVVWHRTTRASGDIALLAVQLDELLASVAPELPREPGKVASIASVNPSPKPLGRALVRTFEPLTQSVLLVVDEWEAADTPEADELLAMLVDGLHIRFVITTRERPEWFAPRLEVYGEGLEIGVDELTMTEEEAAEVLSSSGAVAGRARLMRTAAGWPAVLGLAAMSGEVNFTSGSRISRKLYEFLATELLAAPKPATQDALVLLAVASISQVEHARRLLGAEGESALADAANRGLIAVGDRGSLVLHPLLKNMLRGQFGEWTSPKRKAALSRYRLLLTNHLWDEALSVAETTQDPSFVVDAVAAALPDLLAAGRTSSLERWIDVAHAAEAASALIDYAESEALLRRADFNGALALAGRAARALDGDLAARAHFVAARAAHLGDRSRLRDDHLRQALPHATRPATRLDVLWLSFASAAAEERPESEVRFKELTELAPSSHDHALRLATGRIHMAVMSRGLDEALEWADAQLALINRSDDPYNKTVFLNQFANALALAGRYRQAEEVTELELALATEYDLDFVRHYALANRAHALIGMRKFSGARQLLREVQRRLDVAPNPYLECQVSNLSATLLLSEGNLRRAADVLSRPIDGPAEQSALGERHAIYALVLSALQLIDEADAHRAEAERLSSGLETTSLLAAERLVRAAQAEEAESALAAAELILELGTGDALVLAWRSCLRVAQILVRDSPYLTRVSSLLLAAGDLDIAKRAGLRLPRAARPRGVLSAREREVHELIAQGLKNEEIAKLLFISLSTTKVHVRHIFEKLGVHSRIEAARLWEADST